MLSDKTHTFTHCTSVLCVHIAVYRVGFGIAVPVYCFFLLNRHAVTHKHFGNNNLT